MIKLNTESPIPIRQVSLALPGKPHLSTLYRWIRSGCGGVYLETLLVGGRRFTTQEALQRFVNKLTNLSIANYREPELSDEDLRRSS